MLSKLLEPNETASRCETSWRHGATQRSSYRMRAMKQPASDEPNMTKSLRDIFFDIEEEFAQLVSPNLAEFRRLGKSRYLTHAERNVVSPYNPSCECHPLSSTKNLRQLLPNNLSQGFVRHHRNC
ncbi:unnamed protein product [Dicrocoelium dendriticum]|nr:unnamed protein product [Dicrocoelium dendriticum]